MTNPPRVHTSVLKKSVAHKTSIWLRMHSFHPRRDLFVLGGGGNTTTLQNVPDGLIADVVTQLGQGSGHAVITPGAIVLCHVDNQVFQFLTWCPRGGGTNAANVSNSANGARLIPVVPSDHARVPG